MIANETLAHQQSLKVNGKEYKGPTHKDARGKLMSGAVHTKSSKYLVHKKPKIK